MGRISKRKAAGRQAAPNCGERRFKAGIYARLSSDQDARKNESIEVQVEIAKKYVEEWNGQNTGKVIDVVECYTDLGKTGSNFKREGFLRLLQDIRLGEINCVIVKDLSRFGRNYLEAGNYIEKIFPFLGVRFIAVSDGFDTGEEGNENGRMASEIKNLVNDMYAKDFSKKAKLHLKQRREEGSYVGGPPPYGYITKWDGKKRRLEPDENTKEIVRFIYESFVETESYAAVADVLNRKRVNPPCVYRKTKEAYYTANGIDYKGWDKGAVERMIKSETYAGTLAQGKTRITARDEKNRVCNPVEDWVIANHAHEPLVGGELYRRASEIRWKIKKRTLQQKRFTKDCPIEENIFDRVLYCGVCGKKMTRYSHIRENMDGEKTRQYGYFCSNGGQTKYAVCPQPNHISKKKLIDLLLPLIRMEFEIFLNMPKHFLEYGKGQSLEAAKNIEAKLREAERKIRRFREEEGCFYMEYRAGKIPQKDYMSFKAKREDRLKDVRKQQEAWEKERKELNRRSVKRLAAVKALFKLESSKELTREITAAFVSKISVYPGKRIEVLFAVTSGGLETYCGHADKPAKQANGRRVGG